LTPPQLPPYLAQIHRELGIPAHYAAARGLAFHPEAVESALVDVGPNPDGRAVPLTPATAHAWSHMQRAARQSQIELIPISGFRSVERQRQIVLGKLSAGKVMDDILRYIAAPGFSEHHTGRALDIGTPGYITLEEDFAQTPAFAWLETHAERFGFSMSYPRDNPFGIGYEPWHWCHID
jgi:D-alanyl-D-alanine carboxypeptidase